VTSQCSFHWILLICSTCETGTKGFAPKPSLDELYAGAGVLRRRVQTTIVALNTMF
jgi:hypothetical protein